MIRLLSRITFEQRSTPAYPNRKGTIQMPFLTDSEISHSWKNLTDTSKIKFPRKVIIRDITTGAEYDIRDKVIVAPLYNPEIGPPQPAERIPLLLRGDKIKIEAGYDFNYDEVFNGYVSQITLKQPIEIVCEDNMYRLKQIPAKNKTYRASVGFEGIINDLISQANAAMDDVQFSYAAPINEIQTDIGNYTVLNMTIAQVLDDIKKNYHIFSSFDGTVLHASALSYSLPSAEADTGADDKVITVTNAHNFVFQGNIVSDELQYTRADDVRIGIKAYSVQKELHATLNKDGTQKTSHNRLEATVGDQDGEIRTYFSPGATTVEQLKAEATARLRRYYYEGFRGTFTTFLQPQVKHGDIVNLIDRVLPERNGSYFVKSVSPSVGMNGGRQKIELDMRIDGNLTLDEIRDGV